MKIIVPILFAIFGFTSCSTNRAEMYSKLMDQYGPAEEAPEGAQEIDMDTYLKLPKSLAGIKNSVSQQGYQVEERSPKKLVAIKEFRPAVVFFTEEGGRMLTRTHEIEAIQRPDGVIIRGIFVPFYLP